MRVPGTLAIVGSVLLVVQLVFGGALNEATHDSQPLTLVPLALGLICLWIAFWRGLAKGPAAVRLAVLCGFGSLAFFAYAVMAMYANTSALLAASAALFILAVTLGVFAYTNERATSHESSVRE